MYNVTGVSYTKISAHPSQTTRETFHAMPFTEQNVRQIQRQLASFWFSRCSNYVKTADGRRTPAVHRRGEAVARASSCRAPRLQVPASQAAALNQDSLRGFHGLFIGTSELVRFYFLVLLFLTFSLLVPLTYRIVSYRVENPGYKYRPRRRRPPSSTDAHDLRSTTFHKFSTHLTRFHGSFIFILERDGQQCRSWPFFLFTYMRFAFELTNFHRCFD